MFDTVGKVKRQQACQRVLHEAHRMLHESLGMGDKPPDSFNAAQRKTVRNFCWLRSKTPFPHTKLLNSKAFAGFSESLFKAFVKRELRTVKREHEQAQKRQRKIEQSKDAQRRLIEQKFEKARIAQERMQMENEDLRSSAQKNFEDAQEAQKRAQQAQERAQEAQERAQMAVAETQLAVQQKNEAR